MIDKRQKKNILLFIYVNIFAKRAWAYESCFSDVQNASILVSSFLHFESASKTLFYGLTKCGFIGHIISIRDFCVHTALFSVFMSLSLKNIGNHKIDPKALDARRLCRIWHHIHIDYDWKNLLHRNIQQSYLQQNNHKTKKNN